jgi:hypothetical protein
MFAIHSPSTAPATTSSESANAATWNSRLTEISDMDKSNLTPTEKKDLRKEVRTIKANRKAASGGIYLSAGAIILLAILLVLLL